MTIDDSVPGANNMDANRQPGTTDTNASNGTSNGSPLRHRAEVQIIFVLCLLGVLGLAFCLFVHRQVFPEASIDLKVPRAQILQMSETWAADLGYKKKNVIKSIVFGYDGVAKTFLEHEFGASQANNLMKDQIPVWCWSTQFCQEFQQEAMRISLSLDGHLGHFYHRIENDRTITSISHDDAQKVALDFITRKARLSLAGYKLIVDQSVTQLHRTDHSFVWEDTTRQWKEAKLRTSIYISGNLVTGYNHYLYVPEVWMRKLGTLRSYNSLFQNIAQLGSLVLNTASIFVFFWALVSRKIRWRFTLVSAGVMTVLYLLNSANNFQIVLSNYTTEGSFNAYLVKYFLGTAAGALGSFIGNAVLFGTAEILYRRYMRKNIAMENLFNLKALRSPQVVCALIVGHAAVGIALAWQMIYYLAGKHLHFWCPLEISNYQVLAASVPAFAALYIGVFAATAEEFTYRVIGLSLVQKVTRNFWAANLIQAAAWGFMHSNYPQEPAFARGIELTVVGMLWGWIYKRYGIVPCLIGHYLFDAIWGVMPLMSSHEAILKLTGMIVVVPFLIVIAFALYLISKSGIFRDDALLANVTVHNAKKATTEQKATPKVEIFEYQPLLRNVRMCLVFSCVVAAFLVAFRLDDPTPRLGSNFPSLSLPRDKAVSIARKYLLANHYGLDGQLAASGLSAGPANMGGNLQYVFEKLGFQRTSELAIKMGMPYVWTVRLCRPLDPEEYKVQCDGQGKIVSFYLHKAEDAPGPPVSESVARARAEQFIIKMSPQFTPLKFESVKVHKRANRTDYEYTFTSPKFKVAEADYKLYVNVTGGTASGVDGGWNIPSKWYWDRDKRTLKDEFFQVLGMITGVLIALAFIWWLWGVLRTGAIRWRPAIVFGSILGVLVVVPQAINTLPQALNSYNTTTPFITFVVTNLIGRVGEVVGYFSLGSFVIALSLASFHILFPRTSIISMFTMALRQGEHSCKKTQVDMWIDGVLVSYGGIAIVAIVVAAWEAITNCVLPSPEVSIESFGTLCSSAGGLSPTLHAVSNLIPAGAAVVVGAPILAGLYAKFCKNRFSIYFTLVTIFSIILLGGSRHWQDATTSIIISVLMCVWLWVWMTKLARKNFLSYFLAGYCMILVEIASDLFHFSLPLFMQDFVVISFLFLWPIFYVFYLKLTGPFDVSAQTGTTTQAARKPEANL